MTQDLFPHTIQKEKHGTVWWAGSYECRNWHGYFQSREGGRGSWIFYVEGFTDGRAGEEQTAFVARVNENGSLRGEPCPIDHDGKILVLGSRYGRDRWNH